MTAAALSLLLLLGVGATSTNSPVFWDVRIELAEEAMRALSSEPRKPVNARVHFGNGQLLKTRVKLKGQGSFQSVDQKPGFTLQFDHTVVSNLPFTSRKIHLNNSTEDTSYLKEKVGAELFRRAGIAAPRLAHARVSLNNRELGLYVLKEGFSEEFMLSTFGNTNGTIFDRDSSDPKERPDAMDLDAGDEARGRIKLNELWSAANESDLNKRLPHLEQVLDVDTFLKFIATEIILCHWDGYALSENNFRLYLPANGKAQFLPSGMDQIFAKPDLAWKPRFSGKVARAFMETESADERYEATFTTLLPHILNTREISDRIAEVIAEISPHLTRKEMAAIRVGADELIPKIEARRQSLLKQLAAPERVLLSFVDGSAVIDHWQPLGKPEGGTMNETSSNLVIHAGPKTSASWRAELRLAPGTYRITSQVEARKLMPLSFGNRQGACLRVLGKDTQSKNITGTRSETLQCEFQVSGEETVVLVCEVRASGGQVRFRKPIEVHQMAVK